MDAVTEMDALLHAVRERQRRDLEARIDVAARLDELKEDLRVAWWSELEEYRETLVAKTARALSPSWWRPAGDCGTARYLVDITYRDAVDNLLELAGMTPSRRRRWLLNRTLAQVVQVVEDRRPAAAPRATRGR